VSLFVHGDLLADAKNRISSLDEKQVGLVLHTPKAKKPKGLKKNKNKLKNKKNKRLFLDLKQIWMRSATSGVLV